MSSLALIGDILNPLIEPFFEAEKNLYDTIFACGENNEVRKHYLRGFRRSSTYSIDWAGDKLLIATKDNVLLLHDPEADQAEQYWTGEWMSMQCDPQQPHIAAAPKLVTVC